VRDAERRAAQVFDLRPKAPVDVRREPAFSERTAAAHYTTPAPDGTRPGVYWLPLPGPTYGLLRTRSLSYHEAVPGHHFQLALQQEMTDLVGHRASEHQAEAVLARRTRVVTWGPSRLVDNPFSAVDGGDRKRPRYCLRKQLGDGPLSGRASRLRPRHDQHTQWRVRMFNGVPSRRTLDVHLLVTPDAFGLAEQRVPRHRCQLRRYRKEDVQWQDAGRGRGGAGARTRNRGCGDCSRRRNRSQRARQGSPDERAT
jgi:hypothetical protein